MTYSEDNQQYNGFSDSNDDGARSTQEGWAIDPADGDRVYVTSRGQGKFTPNVAARRGSSGDMDLETFLRQYPLAVQNNDADLPPVRTNRDRARAVPDRNPQHEEFDRQAIADYEQRMQSAGGRELDVASIYRVMENVGNDQRFMGFLEQYDPVRDPVNFDAVPGLREQFERIAKMFGTSYENSRNVGTSRQEIMAYIKYHGLDKADPKQFGKRQDTDAYYAQQEQNLKNYWKVSDSELRRRIGITKAIANAFANAEERKFVAQNPAEACAQTWDALQNNPEFIERVRNAGIDF